MTVATRAQERAMVRTTDDRGEAEQTRQQVAGDRVAVSPGGSPRKDGRALAVAIIDALSDDDLRALAERLAPYLPAATTPEPDPWLDAHGAAEYLGITTNALHKLTASRLIPFEQDGPGCKCFFRRSELDAWRERGGSRGRR